MSDQKRKDSATVDRLPPHSVEGEQGVLGCILIDPQQSMGLCVEAFKEGAEYFYDLRHQMIYKTLVELFDDREPIDLITLQERLRAWQLLDQVGGLGYIATLPDAVPSAANLSSYLEIVREKYLLRRMIQACTGAVSRIYDYEGDVPLILDETERDILRVSESRVRNDTPPIKELVKQSLVEFEDAFSKGKNVTGIATSFSDFDVLTGGLQQGNMVVIAARPGIGKTSLGLNIADYIACEVGLPVGVFSLEMTAREVTKRMICSRARVNMRNIREGFLAERDFPKLTAASAKISKAPIYIDDTSGLSILQVRAKARRWWQQFGIKALFIDYLQLMNALGTKRRFESRQQEVSDISNGVKALAKELNIPVVVLAQLNRDIERDKNRAPRLSDLRESGSIEADADIVSFLYNAKKDSDDDEAENNESSAVNLLVQKNRNGPTGTVNLTFLKSITRFESAARISDNELPYESEPKYYKGQPAEQDQ